MLDWSWAAVLALAALPGSIAQGSGVPLTFRLAKPGDVTLVIEDSQAHRVRNLLAETRLPAGRNTVIWDGYDDGARTQDGSVIRHRVPPGIYHLRGLTHAGLHLQYEFSVYSPGTPPWKTRDGSGGWLADHSPPGDLVFLPAGSGLASRAKEDQLLVCSTSGESGDEFVWLTASGRRISGFNTGFSGGDHLARDAGSHAVAGIQAYVLTSGERDPDNNTIDIRAFHADGELEPIWKTTFPMAWKQSVLPAFKTVQALYGNNGLAAYDGLVVFAFTRMNRLVFIDTRRKAMVGEATIPSPRGLAFDPRGRLCVITGTQVKRYHISATAPYLQDEQTRIASGLESPRRLTLDRLGRLYVVDWGGWHQIRVFSPAGRLLRIIGKPGGPQLGHYDEWRMSYPCGMALDRQDRLWVAEAEVYPKRLSLWSASGAFERAWYGPPKYGGGGAIDGGDPSRLFYAEYDRGGGIEFRLDWKSGVARPANIYWRPGALPDEPMPGPAPERAYHLHGRTYLVNCYNGNLRYNQDRGTGIWQQGRDGIARPVAIIANAGDMNHRIWGFDLRHKAAINALWHGQDPNRVLFVWCDLNGDHVAQPDEIRFVVNRDPAHRSPIGDLGLQPMVHPDLSITTSWGTRIPPPRFDGRGTPIYSLSHLGTVGDTSALRSPEVAGGWTLTFADGEPSSLAGTDTMGHRKWRINGVVGGQPVPGQLVKATRPLGPPVTPRTGQAGPILAINGEMGEIFLVTLDGLFLQTLGGDNRFTPLWRMPAARRGMSIDAVSFGQEHFHPTITQTPDGSIFLVVGHEQASIVRLDGLQSVRRLDLEPVRVSPADVAGLPATRVEPVRRTERNTLSIPLEDGGITIDGDLADWPADTAWARIDARASAAVRLSGGTLYAAFRTGDPRALDNAGGDYHYLFKRGGALDLMIGTSGPTSPARRSPVAGDLRLLVTQVAGRTRATLYRAVASGAAADQSFVFDSPIGRVHFDQVLDVSDHVRLAGGSGSFELAVPLSLLGWSPHHGELVLGDLGILRGSAGQTTQRVYWNNQNTQIVSDIPGEARLQPGNWGVWTIP